MTTIQDIADEVGVSKAAVSRILNNKGSFSKDTIQKVYRTAKEMGYTLPIELQAFEELDFKIIAAVLPLTNKPYYSILASYLEAAAYSFGYSLMICSSLFNKEKEEVLFNYLKERKVNGIIYGSFTDEVKIDSSLPIVTIGHELSSEIPTVRSDNYMAGVIAARHLHSKGCKNLLYISAYQVGRSNDERYRGFKDTANNFGITVSDYFVEGSESMSDILGTISKMFTDNSEADGLFAESHSLALNSLRVGLDLGIKIPNQLKILGYGNQNLMEFSYPKLSYIKENTEQIAQTAVSILVDIIEGSERPSTKQNGVHIVPVSIEQNTTT
ncbi:TPA: LacI family DNA-binding transcriptional regulator [Streptococcus suis]|nr:LacI family DNA-binding transcriptional regulator [Streptococcus suis]